MKTCSPRALCWLQPSLIYCLCSFETRQKIGIGVKKAWERKNVKAIFPEDCVFYWKNLIAEASRQGFVGEEEMQWNTYETLDEQLKQEWLKGVEQMRNMRREKSFEKWNAKKMLREACVFDWKNLIAEASRQGFVGEEEMQWNSYETLAEQFKQEWREDVVSRENMRRANYRERGFVKRMLQKACVFHWKNLIAEASRRGFIGEEELQWNTYETLDE